MKNTENWWKSKIMRSFLFAVFTHGATWWRPRDYERGAWTWLIFYYKVFPSCSKGHQKFEKLIFGNELRNYDVTWWFFGKTDITTEFSVVDLVKMHSQSPVWSKFEKQSRMCFDQIHIKPTFYRPLKGGLLSHVTSESVIISLFYTFLHVHRMVEYQLDRNSCRWFSLSFE